MVCFVQKTIVKVLLDSLRYIYYVLKTIEYGLSTIKVHKVVWLKWTNSDLCGFQNDEDCQYKKN